MIDFADAAEEAANPLIPAVFDIAWSGVLLAAGVFVVVTLFSIWSKKITLDPGIRALWTAIVLIAPFVGALLWWLVARRSAPAAHPAPTP